MALNSAKFSSDRRYRYWLLSTMLPGAGTMAVIGLNPSTADENQDDPTVRKCKSWAQRLGFGRLLMLNMYAWRATDPQEMWAAHRRGADIVGGPANFLLSLQEYCVRFEARRIIAAWGKDKLQRSRLLAAGTWELDCLKKNGDGSPSHPLYLPYSLIPRPWNYEAPK